MSRGSPEPDQRIVWGMNCAWWDSINRAGIKKVVDPEGHDHFFPCCPYCGSPLLSMSTWKEWMDANIAAQEDGNPGHVANLIEQRGKCPLVARTTKTDPGQYYVHRVVLSQMRAVK